ncbi:LuxR C-terminal-related transcriptional regulator [Propionicimonas sp.]|uniref:LuxR C-terminal-related transcriptional regulator n=1 Tax=Propionicimonas sp. TaxID=1955623 RepID=UPI0039E66644
MRVVVADDAYLVRTGICEVLRRAGCEVVVEVGDAASLLAAVGELHPDAAVVDIRMPPTQTDEGIAAARAIRTDFPDTAVLVLSMHLQASWALSVLQDQPESVGYLLKDRVADGPVLVDALRRLTEGETVIDPTIVARLLNRGRAKDPLAGLTDREREILSLMAQGRTNAGIATELSIAERTVETHTTAIMNKLGILPEAGHRRVLAVLAYLARNP